MFCRLKSSWVLVLTADLFWLIWCIGCSTQSELRAHDDYRRTLQATRAVVERCAPGYVFIGGGSGAVISPDGLVVTNAHVVRHPARPGRPGKERLLMKWQVRTPDRKIYNATVLGACSDTDLALLQIEGAEGLDYIPLGDSDELSPGEQVIAIGNPFMLGSIDRSPTVTVGVVSVKHLNKHGVFDGVMTDTPINPGNSGGPLINLDGELVGVNGQMAGRYGVRASTGAGYAVSSNQLKRYMKALKSAKGNDIRAGTIRGIHFDPDTVFSLPTVMTVRPESPAAKAAFRPDDVIRSVNGTPVRTPFECYGMMARWPAGTEVTLKVENNGWTREFEYALDVTEEHRSWPYVGIKLDEQERGKAKIVEVAPDSPAEKAGIRKGDIVEKLIVKNMEPIEINRSVLLPLLLQRVRPGGQVELEILRGKKHLTVKLTVGEAGHPPRAGMF